MADFAVQIGVGSSFGMLFAKAVPVISVLDGALIGAGSGVVSALAGRVDLILEPGLEEGDMMRKILFRVRNSCLTIAYAALGHLACYIIELSGRGPLSVHDAHS